MQTEPDAIYVNANLSIELVDGKPTWPRDMTLQQVRAEIQSSREMYARRLGQLDELVALLAPLGKAGRKEAG